MSGKIDILDIMIHENDEPSAPRIKIRFCMVQNRDIGYGVANAL